MYFDRIKGP